MALKPMGHRLLLRPDPIETTTESGIVYGFDSARERGGQIFGTVVAISDDAYSWDDKPWVNIGDHVAYARYAGKFIRDPETEEDFVIINDEDIVARVEE